jgi:hypothetical protein
LDWYIAASARAIRVSAVQPPAGVQATPTLWRGVIRRRLMVSLPLAPSPRQQLLQHPDDRRPVQAAGEQVIGGPVGELLAQAGVVGHVGQALDRAADRAVLGGQRAQPYAVPAGAARGVPVAHLQVAVTALLAPM